MRLQPIPFNEVPWGEQVHSLGTVPSTMGVARQLAQEGAPHGTTVVAHAQTQGRGRHGKAWASAPGAGLYLTIVLRPPADRDMRPLTLVFGAATLAWVHALGVNQASIKWPNDVLVGEGKLAGLLMEVLTPTPGGPDSASPSGPTLLLGLGINLAQAQAAATALAAAEAYVGLGDLGIDASAGALLPSLLTHLQAGYAAWQSQGMAATLATFRHHHALTHAQVRAQAADGSAIFGTVQKVMPDGGLVLATPTGELTIYAGDVRRVRTLAAEPPSRAP